MIGRVDLRLALVLATAAIPGALAGAALTTILPREVFALGIAIYAGVLARNILDGFDEGGERHRGLL